MTRFARLSIPWIVPTLSLVTAEVYCRTFGVGSDTLAPPIAAVWALFRAGANGSLWGATLFTLATASAGMAIGTLLGVSTGVCLGMWRRGRRAAFLSVEVFRAIPAIALIPLSMLLLGFGMGMEISIAAFATFWPSLIFTTAAVLQIDRQLFEVSALLRLGPLQRCLKIILPAIVPRLLVAMRFAIGMALIASVTVEIVANPFGMGYAMIFAQQSLNPSLMQAWLLWIGLLGYAIHLATIRLETALARRMGAII